MKRDLFRRAFAVVLAAIGSSLIASADTPPFGLTFFDQGSACQFGAPPPDCTYASGNLTTETKTDVQNLQQYTYSDNFDLHFSQAESTFEGTISDSKLHAFSATTYGASATFQGSAYNGSDEYWFDTFTFSPGTYDLDLVFDGTLTENLQTSSIGDLVDTFSFLENGTVNPGNQYTGIVSTLYSPGSQRSIQLSFLTKTSTTLGELLQIRNATGDPGSSTPTGLTIDDSDTGFFTVTPTTDGAGFTTASGLSYSAMTPVPEPGSLSLLGLTLLALPKLRKLARRGSRSL